MTQGIPPQGSDPTFPDAGLRPGRADGAGRARPRHVTRPELLDLVVKAHGGSFDGLLLPTRHRVFARDGDGFPITDASVLAIDIPHVRFA